MDELRRILEDEMEWSAQTGKTIRLHKIVSDIEKAGFRPPMGWTDRGDGVRVSERVYTTSELDSELTKLLERLLEKQTPVMYPVVKMGDVIDKKVYKAVPAEAIQAELDKLKGQSNADQ